MPDTENRLQAKLEQHTTQALLRMDYLDKTMQDINSRIERSAKSVQKHDAQLAELETKMYGSGEEIPIPARIEELFAAVEARDVVIEGRLQALEKQKAIIIAAVGQLRKDVDALADSGQ